MGPAGTAPDGVLLGLFFLVAPATERLLVGGDVSTDLPLLGVVPPGQVVVENPKLPFGTLGHALGAGLPGGGKHVEALADRGEEAKVVPGGSDFSKESTLL